MNQAFKNALLFLLISLVLIVISYFFIDRQLVWFLASHHMRQYSILKIIANDITFGISTIIFLYYIYFFIRLGFSKCSLLNRKVLTICNAVVTVLFLKNILKVIFSRYWTSTFICNNLSLVKNHVYGFNWFAGSEQMASFPSGHASFIFAFSVSLWYLFPKLRFLSALLAILVVVGQIAMYYHFVSDVIAGIALGSLVGFYHVYYQQKFIDKSLM